MKSVLIALLATVAFSGCADVFGQKDPHAPGDPVGVYHLTADVDPASTCAEAAAAAPRPWVFDVTLRRDGQRGYWIASDTPVEGKIDDKGAIAFHSVSRVTVHGPDKAKELGTCVIVRTDDFSGALSGAPDSAAGVKSFSGTLKYAYTVEAGSDCRDVVGPPEADRTSPMFSLIPCEVRFAVTATRTGDPKSR